MIARHVSAAVACLALLWTGSAQAAQSYDNCTGFIDSLPATISTQGTWCLRHDLSTGMNEGIAISIQTNNVTIDCNDFKIGGLAAGAASGTHGIHAFNKSNATIRRCNLRGFFKGVALFGAGGGHLVEDNRVDASTHTGIEVEGGGTTVRRNLVRETGGSTYLRGTANGIVTAGEVDVIDNAISDMEPLPVQAQSFPVGILISNNNAGSVRRNRVGRILGTEPLGIRMYNSTRVVVRDNSINGTGAAGSGRALLCDSPLTIATGNVLQGFPQGAMSGCADLGNFTD